MIKEDLRNDPLLYKSLRIPRGLIEWFGNLFVIYALSALVSTISLKSKSDIFSMYPRKKLNVLCQPVLKDYKYSSNKFMCINVFNRCLGNVGKKPHFYKKTKVRFKLTSTIFINPSRNTDF